MIWFRLTVPAMRNRLPRRNSQPSVGGVPRYPLVVAEGQQPEGHLAVGDVAVRIGHARCGGHALDLDQPCRGASSPGGASPARRRAACTGRRRRRPAGPGRNRPAARSGWRACWPCAAPRAGLRPARRTRPPRGRPRAARRSRDEPGMSAQAKCDHKPVTCTRPAACAASAACTRPAQSFAVAPPRLMPVSASRCSRRGLADALGGQRDLVDQRRRANGEIDVVADRPGVRCVRAAEQAQDRAR